MDVIRDLNISPDIFNQLIFLVVGIGSIWAVIRLYRDFTRPITDDEPPFERPTITLRKHK